MDVEFTTTPDEPALEDAPVMALSGANARNSVIEANLVNDNAGLRMWGLRDDGNDQRIPHPQVDWVGKCGNSGLKTSPQHDTELNNGVKGRAMRNLAIATLGGLTAAVWLISPCPLQAQDAQPALIDKSENLDWEPTSPQPLRTAVTKPVVSDMVLAIDRAVVGSLPQKSNSVSSEIGDLRVLLSASRSKREHSLIQDLLSQPTTSNLAVGGAVEFDLGNIDSIALFGNWTKVRRKPITLFPSRKHFTSDAQSFGMSWIHDDQFLTSLVRFSTGPSGSRTPTERMVEVAGGGLKKANGFAVTLAHPPRVERWGMTYGLDLRQQHVVEDNWFSPTSGQNETIEAVFLAWKF
jgi:hypothetical protein